MKSLGQAARIMVALAIIPAVVLADVFCNTGPGTINTCTLSTRVGIGVESRDSLLAPSFTTLMLGHSPETNMEGGRLQFNQDPANPASKAAFFSNYTHSGGTPVLRVLVGNNQGSNAFLSHWTSTPKIFTTKEKSSRRPDFGSIAFS